MTGLMEKDFTEALRVLCCDKTYYITTAVNVNSMKILINQGAIPTNQMLLGLLKNDYNHNTKAIELLLNNVNDIDQEVFVQASHSGCQTIFELVMKKVEKLRSPDYADSILEHELAEMGTICNTRFIKFASTECLKELIEDIKAQGSLSSPFTTLIFEELERRERFLLERNVFISDKD